LTILDPEQHRRLIAEIDEISRTAGIPRRFIESSMQGVCDDQEIDWVRGYRHHVEKGVYGYCFEGVDHATKMMSMCGALVRNFIDARLMTLNTLIEMLRTNEPINCSALFVPSFHRTTKQGSGVTPFQINLLWQLLEERMLTERQTVVGVQSIAQMRQDYGQYFGDHLQAHFEGGS
jgi:hypothetical protein